MLGLKAALFLVTLFFNRDQFIFPVYCVALRTVVLTQLLKMYLFWWQDRIWEFLLFLLACHQKWGGVCETTPPQLPWKQGQLLKSRQLKTEAISEPQGMSDTYSCVLLRPVVLNLLGEQNIFLTCLKSNLDHCSYSAVSCIWCMSKTVFFKWVPVNAVLVEIFQWAFCLVK